MTPPPLESPHCGASYFFVLKLNFFVVPKSRHRFAVGFCLALTAFAISPARSVMYNRDTGDEKSQELAKRPEFASAASMSGCSAVLIAPDVALSAAHCVQHKPTGRVAIDWKGQKISGEFWSHPTVDLLVAKLDKPFENAAATPPYAGRDETGRLVWKVACGGSEVLGDGAKFRIDGKYRAMTNRIEVDRVPNIPAVTETELHYDFDGPPSKPYKNSYTPYEGGTAPGDSGGPLYMQTDDGQWFVVGVTSGPRNNYYADGRVSSCISFIEEKTGYKYGAEEAEK